MPALGNTPYVKRGGQDDPSRLFYSDQNIAVLLGISIPAGFGEIKSGAIMAKISESTNRLGQYVPYTPEDAALLTIGAWGFAYVTLDGAADTVVQLVLADSYKFAIGDHLGAVDSDGTQVDLGAITEIDRTTYPHIAVLTVTNNLTTGITVAKFGAVYIQSTTASPFVKAQGVLLATVDTGIGVDAQGGMGVLVAGNATLYKDLLYNYDAEVLTDLTNAREVGNYLIF